MKKSFIPLTALALFALVSCNQVQNNTSSSDEATSSQSASSSSEQAASSSSSSEVPAPSSESSSESTTSSESSSESSSEEAVKSVTITNKDELTKEWFVGDANRTMNITLDPAGNVNALINKGEITIVSSDATVISVTGRVLTALKAGQATITVTYGDKSDSVEIETKAEQTAIDEYGTVHAGTEADPLDNEDAIKVAKATGETATTKYYYVKGTVASFRDAPSSYGNVSYYLTPATANGDKFLVYRATLTNGGKVTDDDIWVGAIVTAKVKIVNYNSKVPETSQGGEITNVEGTKPTIQTIEATVAQALTACKALDANSTSTDKYVITGYITAVTSSGFYMGDTKGKVTPTNDDFLVYGWSGDTAAKCTLNAKVKVTTTLKYYKSSTDETKYNYETGTIDSVEVLEEGDAPVTIESINVATALTKTNALDDGATSEAQYDITGYVISVDSAYSTSYKNMSITIADAADATTGLTVFRTKIGDGVDYSKVVAGAKVTIRGYLKKYVETDSEAGTSTVTPELVSGTITALTEAVTPEAKTIEATVAEAVTAAKALASNATSTDNYVITGYVTKISGAYSSNYGNMSFYMSDDLDDPNASFIAYQVACTAEVSATIVSGAKVKVSGKLTNYNGTPETVGRGAAKVELVEAAKGADVAAIIASSSFKVGETSQITVTEQTGVTFAYASSDETVATVDASGLVTGVKAGSATITITASTGRKAYIKVTISDPEAVDTSITVAKAIEIATALDDKASTSDSYDVVGYVVKITSSYDKSNKTMNFTMSDTMDDFSATFVAYKVTVEADVAAKIVAGAKVKVSSKLTKYGTTLETVGGTDTTAVVMADPTGADVKASMTRTIEKGNTSAIAVTAQDGVTFAYVSSDETIATVTDAGVVTGVKEGKAMITITASTGRKAYFNVEVIAALGETEKRVVWDTTDKTINANLPTAASTTDTEVAVTLDSTEMKFGGVNISYNSNGYLFFTSKKTNSSFLYSKTAMGGAITSITIETTASASASAKYAVSFGTEAISTVTTEAGTKVGSGSEYTFNCGVEGAKYFQIASTATGSKGYNGQIASIVIRIDTSK